MLIPLLAGALARFATLDHQSLWGDESATLAILHQPLRSLLPAIRSSESTPPLYYLLAWLWSHAFGFGSVAVRSLSALFGTVTIAVVALIARRLGGVRAGIWAAWFTATDPVLFWYSQEARAYSLFVLLCAVSLGSMLSLRARPSSGRMLAWTAACIAAAATHYFAGFLVGAELLVLFAWPGPTLARRALLPATGAFLATGVPLALLAHTQYVNSGFVRSQGLPKAVAETAGQLLVGYGVDPVMVVCGVVSAVGLLVCLWPGALRWPRRDERSVLALIAAVAVLVPLIVALAGAQLIDMRNLLYLLPVVALLAAAGSVAARPRAAIALPLLAGAAVILHVYLDPTLQRTDYRGAAAAIGLAREPRVVLVRMSGETDLQQYLPRLAPLAPEGAHVEQIVLIGMTMGGGLNRDVEPLSRLRFTPPPGFREVQAESTTTYTLLRYRAPLPLRLTSEELERRAGADVQAFYQP